MGRGAGVGSLVLVLGATDLAGAQTPAAPQAAIAVDAPRSASLSWVRLAGAASCAPAAAIAEGVARVLHREALVAPSRDATAIEARIERIPGKARYRVTIDLSSADGKAQGTRSLESPADDCRALDEPAALAIALMIDPEAATRPPPPPTLQPTVAVRRDVLVVPVPVLVPVPTAPPPAPPAPRPAPESPELTLAIGPSLALGILPGPAPGLRFGVEFGPPATLAPGDGVALGPSSIRVGLGAWSGSIALEPTAGSRSGALDMVAVLPHVALCPTSLWIGQRAALAACLAVDVGAIDWSGTGFDTAATGDVEAFVDVGPVVQARVVVAGPVALELRGSAVVPLVRDRYFYSLPDGTFASAYEPGAVAAMLDAGLAVGLDL